jgi:hypothetical protein
METTCFEGCANSVQRIMEFAIGMTAHEGLARSGADQTEQAAKSGGLAGAVGAEEAGDSTWLDAKGEIGDSANAITATEDLGERPHLETD